MNVVPNPALRLHLKPAEFRFAILHRLGHPVFREDGTAECVTSIVINTAATASLAEWLGRPGKSAEACLYPEWKAKNLLQKRVIFDTFQLQETRNL